MQLCHSGGLLLPPTSSLRPRLRHLRPSPCLPQAQEKGGGQGLQEGDLDLDFSVPSWVEERNQAFASSLKGKCILAPLTKGGNRAFRQLTTEFGCPVTMSEMAYARGLLKGDRVEQARIIPAVGVENCFGAQIATKTIEEGVGAAKLAKESGATWCDLNVGCPIKDASRRGMGAIMLRKPRSLAKMVNGIVKESELPVTVKIRIGAEKVNVHRVVALLARTGAAAVTIHGRTMEQMYRKPADWSLISDVVAANPGLPIIGNGDILTHYDASRRLSESGCHAVMTGRGALIRPWLFKELQEGRELALSAEDRVHIYRRLVALMKEQFGNDEWGRKKAFYFFPWHFSFFHRYRPLPEEVYGEASRNYPLMITRHKKHDDGETLESLSLLERLLRCSNEKAHGEIAAALWDAASDKDAIISLEKLASSELPVWEAEEAGREPGNERSSRDTKTGQDDGVEG
ncbi:hypothetical protein DUNSADRAFT_9956 [Dunaliella salina]|uniref:tRNA-dihydrouridine(47) synthase [NAD(P)(+)] n=1 Tax=Dunaliella salina TaxID=3046 RepID=A0ABQ7GGG0_DUNSA|nr:hypothetical protein DUNSADRAFT_9956 [Dunaliella salina]|eukprot:KAF5833686.1 hypothetical protein DUNSADRAFT_9956 [Dunaliella salina]